MNKIIEINYEINPNLNYWGIERDFDAIALEFNEHLSTLYPNVELRFDGCNTQLLRSISIGVDGINDICDEFNIILELHELWDHIDFSDEKFFKP